jgi:hypothetical protein
VCCLLWCVCDACTGNYEEVNKLCLHGKEFASHVTASEGWRMVNEGNDIKPKWGFVTRKVRGQEVWLLPSHRAACLCSFDRLAGVCGWVCLELSMPPPAA